MVLYHILQNGHNICPPLLDWLVKGLEELSISLGDPLESVHVNVSGFDLGGDYYYLVRS